MSHNRPLFLAAQPLTPQVHIARGRLGMLAEYHTSNRKAPLNRAGSQCFTGCYCCFWFTDIGDIRFPIHYPSPRTG